MEQAVVSDIAVNRDGAKVTVLGLPDRAGVAHQILGAVAEAGIGVDVIIQNISREGCTDLSFTVHRNDFPKVMDLLATDVAPAAGARSVVGDPEICKVSIVGIGMKSHVGVAARMFKTLSEEGINIRMISTGEIRISVVIDEKHLEAAVRSLRRAFGLDLAPPRLG